MAVQKEKSGINLMEKIHVICGLIGSLCFLIGDILLGWVNDERVDKRAHSFISMEHGKGYKRSKIFWTMTLAAIGIPFLYLGMMHCGDIALDAAWKEWISISFALTSVAWFIIHIGVALNVYVYSWVADNVSEEKAIDASSETKKTFSVMMIVADVIAFAAFIIMIAALAKGKTTLPQYYIAFTPLVGACIAACIEKILPKSRLRKTVGTIQLNVGLIVWFLSMLVN